MIAPLVLEWNDVTIAITPESEPYAQGLYDGDQAATERRMKEDP